MKNTNRYDKDYRKTPEQNKKRIVNAVPESLTTRVRRWFFYPVFAVMLIALGIFAIQKMNKLPGVATQEQKIKETRTVAKKVSKKHALQESYGEAMILGDVLSETNDSKTAAKHYFDAKTIYPRNLEPRIELAETYLKRCEERGSYCLHVARELMYARMFVKEDTPSKLIKKMDNIQHRLDKIYTVKDSSRLYVH